MMAPAVRPSSPSILLVGCGRMGRALLAGWLSDGIDSRCIRIVEPAAFADDDLPPLAIVSDPAAIEPAFVADVVVLAVKPQVMAGVLPAYAAMAHLPQPPVFLSIAAGRTLAFFQRHLGSAAPIVRAMPNTPAAIGKGVTAACCNAHVTDPQRTVCDDLLAAVGRVVWVDDESLLDPVTALSGSGPAYVFHMVEALAAAGEAAGLSPDLAATLARETMIGSAALLSASDETPEALRRAVTSPGGTTEAALGLLMAEDGLTRLLTRAIAAAALRSRTLAE